MEKFVIIAYAVLFAILFDGSKGKNQAEIRPHGNLGVAPVHHIYGDSKPREIEKAPRSISVREPD
jgi:hypothetical protein